jgi:hypothetical protein
MGEGMNCRICDAEIHHPVLNLPAPALATNYELLDIRTQIYVCTSCSHVQSPDLPDLEEFYSSRYKYCLDSEEYDQLYEIRNGISLYRTDAQATVVLGMVVPPLKGRVLDYGAAKAATLRKICVQRPDLSPHVFDISEDYRPSWSVWLPNEAIATHRVPPEWRGRFGLIMAHYVFQHVQKPVALLRSLSELLAPEGRIFFSAPDLTANTGALLVAENMNHFTPISVRRMARQAGLKIDTFDTRSLPGTFAVLCQVSENNDAPFTNGGEVDGVVGHVRSVASRWSDACSRLDSHISANRHRPAAIFGAGFYGAFLLTRMAGKGRIASCVDSNPHLWGKKLFGVPVGSPETLPATVEIVYVGLNPEHARAIAATVPALQRPGLDLVFIGQ